MHKRRATANVEQKMRTIKWVSVMVLLLPLLGCESAEHKAQRIEAERQAQAQIQAQNAEAERARQAAEAAKELREELGDEIDVQVAHWTMGSEMIIGGRTPAGPVNHQFDEEMAQGFGFRIKNLKMFIKRSTGALTIMFDCQFLGEEDKAGATPFMVRLFDENGQYITHFRTGENFATPVTYRSFRDRVAHGGLIGGDINTIKELKAEHNVLQYRVSRRDADYIQKAEFGFLV
jgi:predicted nucleic acid-binding protein